MLFFVRRTWANRITADIGLPARSPETTWLVELVIWAAKQSEQDARRATGVRLRKADSVLLSAMRMASNPTAIGKLAAELSIGPEAARALLVRFRISAKSVATEHGRMDLVRAAAASGY